MPCSLGKETQGGMLLISWYCVHIQWQLLSRDPK